MLPSLFKSRWVEKTYYWLILLSISFYSLPSFAKDKDKDPPQVSTVTAGTVLQNITEQLPNLTRMVTAFAYVMGMIFIFQGIIKLKHFGESRTMMSQEHGLMGPIILLTVGALLLYLPSSVQVGLSTFWSDPNPYSYIMQQDQWGLFINNCLLVIQFFGTIAFIRGLVKLSHLSESRGQPGQLGGALAHIIGGIFCINIYQFIQVVLNTIGIAN